MPPINHPDSKERVYRRARPRDFQDVPLEQGRYCPLPDLFVARDGEGLSVFAADMTTPYDVLNHHIETVRRNLQSAGNDKDRKRYEKQLEKSPDVETMIALGWRIVELNVAQAFPHALFGAKEPSDDSDEFGHLEITGSHQDFQRNSLDIDDKMYRVLTPEECRQRKDTSG